jgi:hypothetical protein
MAPGLHQEPAYLAQLPSGMLTFGLLRATNRCRLWVECAAMACATHPLQISGLHLRACPRTLHTTAQISCRITSISFMLSMALASEAIRINAKETSIFLQHASDLAARMMDTSGPTSTTKILVSDTSLYPRGYSRLEYYSDDRRLSTFARRMIHEAKLPSSFNPVLLSCFLSFLPRGHDPRFQVGVGT